MLAGSFWEMGGTYLAVLTPLVAVPLSVITFYLRTLHDQQAAWKAELVRRADAMDVVVGEMRKTMGYFERDYATKEEWLREYMETRRVLEGLKESTVRLETLVRTYSSAPLQIGAATDGKRA